MRARHPAVIRVAVLAFISVSACGGGSSGYPTASGGQQPPASTSSTISVKNNRFDPSATTVTIGTTVTWTWDACSNDGYGGQTCVDHTVTFDAGGGSPTLSSGAYTRQFNTAGTFNYRCIVHGASMTGQVVVR